MHRSTRLCLLLLALALPGLTPAAIITLSDNVSQGLAGFRIIGSLAWKAQAFSTTDSAFRITDVALPLSRNDVTGGDLLVSIFNSSGSGGTPGAKLADVATVLASSLGTTSSALYDIPNLSITLTPTTSYFLVLSGVGLTGGAVWWDATLSTSGTGFPSARNSSADGGASWGANNMEFPNQMRIQADAGAVPEPATLALFAIGLAGLEARRAARRRC